MTPFDKLLWLIERKSEERDPSSWRQSIPIRPVPTLFEITSACPFREDIPILISYPKMSSKDTLRP